MRSPSLNVFKSKVDKCLSEMGLDRDVPALSSRGVGVWFE